MSEIINKPHKCLNSKASPVALDFIKTAEFKSIIKRMEIAMKEQDDGVAIAAPQINESIRVFVISTKHLEKDKKNIDTVYINPRITKTSKEKAYMLEGCLSVRWLYGEVNRYKKCTIEYLDVNGKKKQTGAAGLLSQIFQHEIDHLDGVLFDSKARKLENLPPEEHKKNKVKDMGNDTIHLASL